MLIFLNESFKTMMNTSADHSETKDYQPRHSMSVQPTPHLEGQQPDPNLPPPGIVIIPKNYVFEL